MYLRPIANGRPRLAEVKITPAMLEAGARVIDDRFETAFGDHVLGEAIKSMIKAEEAGI